MKKRTKKKLGKYAGGAVKGLVKLVVVYPLKGVWWGVRESYRGVRESVKKSKKKGVSVEGVASDEVTREVIEGKLKVDASYDSLKEVLNKQGELSGFEEKLYSHKSMIGLILGARGKGKSAIGMRLLENFKARTGRRVCALGFKADALPSWIKVVGSISEIDNGAVVLIDEGGIEFSSRSSMSSGNKLLSELLLIARHKDLSVMFITQNSSNLEVNAIRQADYLILKPSSLLQKDFERRKIKEIYESVSGEFEELKEDKGLAYIYGGNYSGFVSNSLPSFWSEGVSKGYAHRGKNNQKN